MNHDYRTRLDVLRVTRNLVLTYLLLGGGGGGTDIKASSNCDNTHISVTYLEV